MRTATTLLALAALLAACGGGSSPSTPAALMRVPLDGSPQRGRDDAWVTIVEFSDFQCPYCGAAEPTIRRILADDPADVRLVYKHFPLGQHANARPAANAAECARAQGPARDGHFWELHDLLFEHQSALGADDLALYASQIGLDMTAWQSCFDARQYDGRVQADADLGASAGVRGTPTFAINGKPLVGAAPLETFRAEVESARATAIASGIPRDEYYARAVLGN